MKSVHEGPFIAATIQNFLFRGHSAALHVTFHYLINIHLLDTHIIYIQIKLHKSEWITCAASSVCILPPPVGPGCTSKGSRLTPQPEDVESSGF